MRQTTDVHGKEARYARALRSLKADMELSAANRRAILRFESDLQAEGVTLPRLLKYLYVMGKLAKWLRKDLEKATVQDIKRLVADVNRSKYADWTKADCRIALKRFYRWLMGLPKGQNPPETAWIRIKSDNRQVLPEELLNEDDITNLVEACENSRDRDLILCLYETGGRIGELLNVRRKHIEFDQYGPVLLFSGKTGDRRVRVIVSAPALAQWMNDHPSRKPDSPLWIVIGAKHHGQPLLYDAVRELLRRLAVKANIGKRVNPHSFRHARASHLVWTPGSKMPKICVDLSGRDVDTALLRMHGIERGGEEGSKAESRALPALQREEHAHKPFLRLVRSAAKD